MAIRIQAKRTIPAAVSTVTVSQISVYIGNRGLSLGPDETSPGSAHVHFSDGAVVRKPVTEKMIEDIFGTLALSSVDEGGISEVKIKKEVIK